MNYDLWIWKFVAQNLATLDQFGGESIEVKLQLQVIEEQAHY